MLDEKDHIVALNLLETGFNRVSAYLNIRIYKQL